MTSPSPLERGRGGYHGDSLESIESTTEKLFTLVQEPEFRARFKVGRALGRGAFGVVFSGEQVTTGRPVAIKFMLRMEDATALARLEREGQALAKVAHPGLTRVLDAGSVQGFPYLVTELMTGGTLLERLERGGRFRPDGVLAIAQDLLPALQACHDVGIIHRDIKPDNILFDESGRARLADLGVARWSDAPQVLTATGAVVGTPLYIAPELLQGGEASPASDLYAVGVTLHYLLAAEPPFRAGALPDLLRLHMYEAPPRLDERCGLPTPVASAILRLLAKTPAERPATAKLALAMLEDAVAGREPRSRSGRVRAPRSIAVAAPPPPHRKRVIAVALGIGLAAPLAFVMFPRAKPAPVASATPGVTVSASPASYAAASPPPRYASLSDGGGALPKGAVGRLGELWGQHPNLQFADASRDGRWFATATTNSVRAWDARAARYRAGFRPKNNRIGGLRTRDDGSVAIAYLDDSFFRFGRLTQKVALSTLPLDVYVWAPDTGAVRVVNCTQQAGAWAIPPGARCVAWWDGERGALCVRGLDEGAPIENRGASGPVTHLDVTPDGRTLIALTAAGAEVRFPGGPPRAIANTAGARQVAISADATRAAVSGDAGLTVFALPSGVVLATTKDALTGPEFSPDGTRLAARGADRIDVLDAATLKVVERLPDATRSSFAATGLFRFKPTEFLYPGAPPPVKPVRVAWIHPEARGALYEDPSGALFHWDRVTGARSRVTAALKPWKVLGQPRDGATVHLRRSLPDKDRIRVFELDGSLVREFEIPAASAYVPLSGRGRAAVIHTDLLVEIHEPDGVTRVTQARLERPYPNVRAEPFGPIDHDEQRLILDSPEKGLIVLDLRFKVMKTIWTPAGVQTFNRPRIAYALEKRGAVLSAVDGAIAYLEPRRYVQVATFTEDQSALDASIGAADGGSVLLGYASSAIHLWFPEKKESRIIRDRIGLEVRALGYDARSGVALSLEDGGLMTLWDLED